MTDQIKNRLKQNMRGVIQRFLNSRTRAYREARSKYHYKIDMGKAKAMTLIQNRLNFSEKWDFAGTCHMVLSIEDALSMILPTYSSDPRQQAFRKHIQEVITLASREVSNIKYQPS